MNEKRLWAADMGEGYFRNPVLFTDYSDPDVIRVGDTFYMTASTFSCVPGLPILTSKDLINWDLVNYAIPKEIPLPGYEHPRHGCGIWAPSIRYHQDMFYIVVGLPDEGIFETHTKDPLGEWSPLHCIYEAKGFIDPCPVWCEDGTAYIVHGYAKSRIGFKSKLGIFQVDESLTQALSEDSFIFDGTESQPTIEGPKVYIRDGYYYILSPAGGVKTGWQVALRSRDIHGPYEAQIVMAQGSSYINGPHQGGLVDTPSGEEWFMHFQDRGAFGRICHLQKVTWKDGWPVMGIHPVDYTGEPATVYQKPAGCPFVTPHEPDTSDEFIDGKKGLMWQWMANERPEYFTEIPESKGLFLNCVNYTGQENPILWQCGNILTQKPVCPAFFADTQVDISGLCEGGRCGITIFGGQYAFLQLKKQADGIYLEYGLSHGENEPEMETIEESMLWQGGDTPVLRMQMFGDGSVRFFAASKEAEFRREPEDRDFYYESPVFLSGKATWTGAKLGLFCVSAKQQVPVGGARFLYMHITANKADFRQEDGVDPLFLCAREGNTPLVKRIVEYSKYSLNLRHTNGWGILHYAAVNTQDDPELVRYLSETVGMDMLEGDLERKTPYQLAIEAGNANCAAYFEKKIGVPYDTMYHNPIRTGFFPDPSVVRVGEDYYMVNSTFTYFPCVPISHSKDLIHWTIIGHAITEPDWAMLEGLESGRGYWAPDISYDGEKFYVAVTFRLNDTDHVTRKQVVVSAKNPEGPYGKPAIIEEDGIDPSIFRDDDGRVYMLLNRGARIFELNKDCTEKISEARMLWNGNMMRATEGPHMLKKDGYYYLIVAEGGTGINHRISVARSKDLYGPYESCPYNPILRQENPNAAIQRSGHGKLVQTQNGEWYMVYLCGRLMDGKYTVIGRETGIDPVTWTADGWPIVNMRKGPSVLQKFPNLTPCIEEQKPCFDWMWVKRPDFTKVLELEDGHMSMKGGTPLYEVSGNMAYVTRQRDFTGVFRMRLEAFLPEEGQEAGMTAYYDENTYLSYGVVHRDGKLYLTIQERIGDMLRTAISKELYFPADQPFHMLLAMETEFAKRSFFYALPGQQQVGFHVLSNVNYLCDEALNYGKRFTGTVAGMYVTDISQAGNAYGKFEHDPRWMPLETE